MLDGRRLFHRNKRLRGQIPDQRAHRRQVFPFYYAHDQVHTAQSLAFLMISNASIFSPSSWWSLDWRRLPSPRVESLKAFFALREGCTLGTRNRIVRRQTVRFPTGVLQVVEEYTVLSIEAGNMESG